MLNARHQGTDQHAFFEPEFEVARLVQLFVKPAGFKGFGIGTEFVVGAPRSDSVKRCVGCEHAGFDGGMAAFDTGGIEIASIATNQSTAWEYRFGQSLQSAVVDGACAIADAFATFQMCANAGVCFPALHFFEGADPRVFVVEAEHKTEGHFVVFQVVQKATAKGVVLHGPARGVDHQSGLGFGGVNFPQLFHANGVALRVFALCEVIFGKKLLAQMPARTFGKQGVFGVELHAELEVVGGFAVFANTKIARSNTFDGGLAAVFGCVVVVEHFCRRETGEYFYAQTLRMGRHPLDHIAQRDHVATVVVEIAGHQPAGRAGGSGFAQHQ